jgi:hypothetical protein
MYELLIFTALLLLFFYICDNLIAEKGYFKKKGVKLSFKHICFMNNMYIVCEYM